MKPIAWYDPTNGAVSTDKDSPLFTPLGQVWPLYPQRHLESTTDMLMELADRLGELPDDVDPRAWSHLLVYAPKHTWVGLTEWEREAIAHECGAMSADWLVFMEAVERALKEKNT